MMAETIWWCEFHRAGGDWTWRPGLDCWGAGLGGQDDCDMVKRELIDPADPSDILAAVRTLPGVTTAETVMDHKQFRSWYIPMDEPGTYLLVPLSEEE